MRKCSALEKQLSFTIAMILASRQTRGITFSKSSLPPITSILLRRRLLSSLYTASRSAQSRGCQSLQSSKAAVKGQVYTEFRVYNCHFLKSTVKNGGSNQMSRRSRRYVKKYFAQLITLLLLLTILNLALSFLGNIIPYSYTTFQFTRVNFAPVDTATRAAADQLLCIASFSIC